MTEDSWQKREIILFCCGCLNSHVVISSLHRDSLFTLKEQSFLLFRCFLSGYKKKLFKVNLNQFLITIKPKCSMIYINCTMYNRTVLLQRRFRKSYLPQSVSNPLIPIICIMYVCVKFAKSRLMYGYTYNVHNDKCTVRVQCLDVNHRVRIVYRGGTQKAFKSLDESPGSNEPGFLVRDLWYS